LQEEAVVSIAGSEWRVRVWPEPELLRQIGSSLPGLALVMGALIGLLFFMTLNFARTAYLTSGDLRQARDDLEVRVEERTEELREINIQLQNEIRERARTEETARELSGRLLQARDEEQRRIARELHDSTVQLLGALAIDLEKLQQLVPADTGPEAWQLLSQSADLAEQATNEVRTISHLLHPPILDELGLEGALHWYAEGFSNRSGIPVQVSVESELGRFHHEIEVTVFRIVQEALTNIRRHSGSPSANITVFKDAQHITLQVTDRGRGIQPKVEDPPTNVAKPSVGIGIAGMRERVRQLGGRLDITSDSGGTWITAVLPISGNDSAFDQHDSPQTSDVAEPHARSHRGKTAD
jgi:signal transduction histidine kinase